MGALNNLGALFPSCGDAGMQQDPGTAGAERGWGGPGRDLEGKRRQRHQLPGEGKGRKGRTGGAGMGRAGLRYGPGWGLPLNLGGFGVRSSGFGVGWGGFRVDSGWIWVSWGGFR